MFSSQELEIKFTKPLAVLDTSFLMYQGYFGFKKFSATYESGYVVPTGHIYNVLRIVFCLKVQGFDVVLAVDSNSDRKVLIEGVNKYKADRRELNYNIKDDQFLILLACSKLGCPYIKVANYEADDIISSFISNNFNPAVYSVDNDLMQTNKPFSMIDISNNELVYMNIPAYIKENYNLDLPFLPVWYKTIKGDRSDHIPIGILRFRQNDISKVCYDLQDTQEWKLFKSYMEHNYLDVFFPNETALKRNYDAVVPRYIDLSSQKLKLISDDERLYTSLNRLKMSSFYNYLDTLTRMSLL